MKTEMIHRAFIKQAIKQGWHGTVYDEESTVAMSTNASAIIEEAEEFADMIIIEWYDENKEYIGNIGIVFDSPQAPDESIYDYHCESRIEAIMDNLYKLYK